MLELALVLVVAIAAGLIGVVGPALGPPVIIELGLGMLLVGLVVGLTTGVWYHVVLYRTLAPKMSLPPKWWLAPSRLHPYLSDAEEDRVRPWYRIGGLGFLLCVGGGVVAIAGSLLARS
jgi:hypothetical protein